MWVAFLGGDPDLHRGIAEAASEWTDYGNLRLDFGLRRQTGRYRRWSPSDTRYKAEIRVSFHLGGYWSLVGTDSIDRAIVRAGDPSMNFGGFADSLPVDWQATVLHEFGHALGFHHEHQHPVGGCDREFRWDDDPDYVPTVDSRGQFVADAQGRRPGIYTVLGGPPNRWPRTKVDFNLRQLPNSHAFTVGPFDPRSIMKYYFGAWMFRAGEQSHCFSPRNTRLSDEDKRGMANAYPRGVDAVNDVVRRQREFLDILLKEPAHQPQEKERFEMRLESLP